MQTREQEYARRSHAQVQALVTPKVKKAYRDQYGTLCHKLPILIRTAGLAQALAFVQTRKEAAYTELLDHLADVVGCANGKELAEKSRSAELGAYMRLTQQTLAVLVWYKRFAESVLDVTSDADLETQEAGPAPAVPVGGTS